jgi:hypothetical protein
MSNVMDERMYQLYVDALATSFMRKGYSSFESKLSAENMIAKQLSNQ